MRIDNFLRWLFAPVQETRVSNSNTKYKYDQKKLMFPSSFSFAKNKTLYAND